IFGLLLVVDVELFEGSAGDQTRTDRFLGTCLSLPVQDGDCTRRLWLSMWRRNLDVVLRNEVFNGQYRNSVLNTRNLSIDSGLVHVTFGEKQNGMHARADILSATLHSFLAVG